MLSVCVSSWLFDSLDTLSLPHNYDTRRPNFLCPFFNSPPVHFVVVCPFLVTRPFHFFSLLVHLWWSSDFSSLTRARGWGGQAKVQVKAKGTMGQSIFRPKRVNLNSRVQMYYCSTSASPTVRTVAMWLAMPVLELLLFLCKPRDTQIALLSLPLCSSLAIASVQKEMFLFSPWICVCEAIAWRQLGERNQSKGWGKLDQTHMKIRGCKAITHRARGCERKKRKEGKTLRASLASDEG